MKIKKLIILVLIFLILMEFFLRFYEIRSIDYFRKMKILHKYNKNYFVGLKPLQNLYIKHYDEKWEGQFTTNSLGMRNLEEPDPERKKIICLGDSLVMGFGVGDTETFCYLLNEKFKKKGYQFLNAGIDGLGTFGYYQRFLEIYNKVDNINSVLLFISPNDYAMPEALLKQSFLPDDIIEKERLENYQKKLLDTTQYLLTDWFYTVFIFKIAIKQLLIKFYLLQQDLKNFYSNFLNNNYKDLLKNNFIINSNVYKCEEKNIRFIFHTIGKSYTNTNTKQNKEIQCPEPIPDNILNQCINEPKYIPDLPEFTKNTYKKLITIMNQKKIKLIVVILPMQIEEIYCYSIKKYHPLRMYALQAIKFFKEEDIEVWDLMQFTNTLCKPQEHSIKDYFIPEDGHLTKSGNIWVANLLEKLLNNIL